jgi:hypothetical protein
MDVAVIAVRIERLDAYGLTRREADRVADALAGELRTLLAGQRLTERWPNRGASGRGPLAVEVRSGGNGRELGLAAARAIAGALAE